MDPRRFVLEPSRIRSLLRGPLAALAELGRAPRPGGPVPGRLALDRRPDPDERDAGWIRRLDDLAPLAGRRRTRVSWATCLLSALLSLNYLWLLGFTSFLLGASLFPVTLGLWWAGRGRLGFARLASLSALLVLGYFCHLVSLGLTVLALLALAVLAPFTGLPGAERRSRLRRLGRTSLCLLPLVPLALVYLKLSRRGGPMHPLWENLASAYSPTAWAARLGWVDPLTLAMKDVLPFTDQTRKAFAAFAPVVWFSSAVLLWFSIAVLSWWAGRLSDGHEPECARSRDRRAWLVLAVFLVLTGVLGPDSLGPGHGEYLPQRLVLFGLVSLIPAFDLRPAHSGDV